MRPSAVPKGPSTSGPGLFSKGPAPCTKGVGTFFNEPSGCDARAVTVAWAAAAACQPDADVLLGAGVDVAPEAVVGVCGPPNVWVSAEAELGVAHLGNGIRVAALAGAPGGQLREAEIGRE
eukprot:scaffold23788_cov126-Isochrysis_galbana.AAC.8